MTRTHAYDVIIVGGGLAGAALGGVMARGGLGVLIVEREAHFRDRIRGETTWPWGVDEAHRAGLGDVLERAGRVPLATVQHIEQQQPTRSFSWEGQQMIGYSHPRLQEELFSWAGAQGAVTIRPAKATSVSRNGKLSVTVVQNGRETEYSARLVVGADGKLSGVRRWLGAAMESDPELHRFGGVALCNVASDPQTLCLAITPEVGCFWFPIGDGAFRHYLRLTPAQLRETRVDRSFAAYLAFANRIAPEEMLANAEQAGPIGFFPNNCVWSSHIAGDGIVLIGDAAGAPDPTNGHGTALVFRDVRELSELLLAERKWDAAIAAFAERRRAYYAVIRANDRWYIEMSTGLGEEADRRRERHRLARELDPTLGGFALIEEHGPDGLVPDETARRHYFGEDLDLGS